MACLICDDILVSPGKYIYMCRRCGHISLTEEAFEDFKGEHFSEEQKKYLCIALRQEWDRLGRGIRTTPLTLDDLHRMLSQFRPLEPLEKMDNALIFLQKQSKAIGWGIRVNPEFDYPLYDCVTSSEFHKLTDFLNEDKSVPPA